MKMLRLTIPFSKKELAEAALELVRRNELRNDTYISPAAYLGVGDRFSTDPTRVHNGCLDYTLADAPDGFHTDGH